MCTYAHGTALLTNSLRANTFNQRPTRLCTMQTVWARYLRHNFVLYFLRQNTYPSNMTITICCLFFRFRFVEYRKGMYFDMYKYCNSTVYRTNKLLSGKIYKNPTCVTYVRVMQILSLTYAWRTYNTHGEGAMPH